LWQLTKTKDFGERFANPLIEQNGKFLERNKDLYGPDIVSDYAIDFIQRNKEKSFFLYYPMLLVHDPFVPTPDSEEWNNPDLRYKKNNIFFKDMVEYMDKIVGKIVQELKTQGIEDNTLIMFVGDNGTNRNLVTKTVFGDIKGAKGNTITHGVHVPMIANWPSIIKKPVIYDGVVDLTDFYATFSDILNVSNESDGESLMSIFSGNKKYISETVTIYYDPKWSTNVSKYRNVFSQDTNYKLYQNGDFFDIKNDILEDSPLSYEFLTKKQRLVKEKLSKELSKFPTLPTIN
jgi:arylsulfatase A